MWKTSERRYKVLPWYFCKCPSLEVYQSCWGVRSVSSKTFTWLSETIAVWPPYNVHKHWREGILLHYGSISRGMLALAAFGCEMLKSGEHQLSLIADRSFDRVVYVLNLNLGAYLVWQTAGILPADEGGCLSAGCSINQINLRIWQLHRSAIDL